MDSRRRRTCRTTYISNNVSRRVAYCGPAFSLRVAANGIARSCRTPASSPQIMTWLGRILSSRKCHEKTSHGTGVLVGDDVLRAELCLSTGLERDGHPLGSTLKCNGD